MKPRSPMAAKDASKCQKASAEGSPRAPWGPPKSSTGLPLRSWTLTFCVTACEHEHDFYTAPILHQLGALSREQK